SRRRNGPRDARAHRAVGPCRKPPRSTAPEAEDTGEPSEPHETAPGTVSEEPEVHRPLALKNEAEFGPPSSEDRRKRPPHVRACRPTGAVHDDDHGDGRCGRERDYRPVSPVDLETGQPKKAEPEPADRRDDATELRTERRSTEDDARQEKQSTRP